MENTMKEQTQITEVKAYSYYGFTYVLHGQRLFQVDHNYFLELMPGNEVYGSTMRRLSKQKPIPHSELVSVLSNLLNTVKELI
jgi:hypothetical protein